MSHSCERFSWFNQPRPLIHHMLQIIVLCCFVLFSFVAFIHILIPLLCRTLLMTYMSSRVKPVSFTSYRHMCFNTAMWWIRRTTISPWSAVFLGWSWRTLRSCPRTLFKKMFFVLRSERQRKCRRYMTYFYPTGTAAQRLQNLDFDTINGIRSHTPRLRSFLVQTCIFSKNVFMRAVMVFGNGQVVRFAWKMNVLLVLDFRSWGFLPIQLRTRAYQLGCLKGHYHRPVSRPFLLSWARTYCYGANGENFKTCM